MSDPKPGVTEPVNGAPGTAGPEENPSRPVRRVSAERLERIAGDVTLDELSRESGISRTLLSLSERGFQRLTWEQEKARRAALRRLLGVAPPKKVDSDGTLKS